MPSSAGKKNTLRPSRRNPPHGPVDSTLTPSSLLPCQSTATSDRRPLSLPDALPIYGAVCGVPLPPGLVEASRLPEPIFTPARKAELGDHDENVDLAAVVEMVGRERAEELRDLTLAVYARAAEVAARSGIIVADTKLEFGLDPSGRVVLGDEVLTPDSSRFWPADGYAPGRVQPSFDKQRS